MTDVTFSTKIVVPKDKVQEVKDKISKTCTDFKFKTEFAEKNITVTELDITVSISALTAIKNLLKVVGVPEEDLKVASKFKSFVQNMLNQFMNNLLQRINRGQ